MTYLFVLSLIGNCEKLIVFERLYSMDSDVAPTQASAILPRATAR